MAKNIFVKNFKLKKWNSFYKRYLDNIQHAIVYFSLDNNNKKNPSKAILFLKPKKFQKNNFHKVVIFFNEDNLDAI